MYIPILDGYLVPISVRPTEDLDTLVEVGQDQLDFLFSSAQRENNPTIYKNTGEAVSLTGELFSEIFAKLSESAAFTQPPSSSEDLEEVVISELGLEKSEDGKSTKLKIVFKSRGKEPKIPTIGIKVQNNKKTSD